MGAGYPGHSEKPNGGQGLKGFSPKALIGAWHMTILHMAAFKGLQGNQWRQMTAPRKRVVGGSKSHHKHHENVLCVCVCVCATIASAHTDQICTDEQMKRPTVYSSTGVSTIASRFGRWSKGNQKETTHWWRCPFQKLRGRLTK